MNGTFTSNDRVRMLPEWLKLLSLADAPRRCRDRPWARPDRGWTKAAVRDGGGARRSTEAVVRDGSETRDRDRGPVTEGERLGSFGSNEIEWVFRVFDHMF